MPFHNNAPLFGKIIVMAAALAYGMTGPTGIGKVWACGDGEAPSSCSASSEADAKWMLKRVVNAIAANKTDALRDFRFGQSGFRTADTYVFCVGPDGVMTAHPNPDLQDRDVRDLHDQTGNYFIATMLQTARPNQVAEIRYLFPRPGGSIPIAKTTYYTRADDQVCGVGVYDEDRPSTPAKPPAATLAELRQRLTAEMPANLQADWSAFQQSLDETTQARDAAFEKVRTNVEAAGALFAAGSKP